MRRQVIYDDITSVIAPDTRAGTGYSSGESAWVVTTRDGGLLSVTTRRVPKHLRWDDRKVDAYFKAVYHA